MLARTHFVFGVLFGVIFLPLIKFGSMTDYFIYFFFVQLGVLFPDLDHHKASFHNAFFVSRIIPFLFSHRGFFHSIFPPVILSWFLLKYFGNFFALPFFIGYSSHLIGDVLTVRGVRFFNPFFKFRIRGLLVTGSFTEKVIFFVIMLLILLRIYSLLPSYLGLV
ncbi:metal-dependent hydrolase [archaeon]|nr:metal-dependent hydrolase [archaeon]